MNDWISWLIGLAVIAVAIPVIVWTARNGRSIRRGAALGALFLGIGQAVDPPKRHMLEAADQKKASPEDDEPV